MLADSPAPFVTVRIASSTIPSLACMLEGIGCRTFSTSGQLTEFVSLTA